MVGPARAEVAAGAPAWPAPAKLNLFLHVTGRRKDGYHELQTVFQFLDHGDELRFAVRDDGVLRGSGRFQGHAAMQEEGQQDNRSCGRK